MTVLQKKHDAAESFFSEEQLLKIRDFPIPNHIAIIMDGNRRWAKQRSLSSKQGHWEGAEALTEITRAAALLGVKTLTAYSFSTENWGRSPEEVDALMHLFSTYLHLQKNTMIRDGVCLHTIGDLSRFPQNVQNAFRTTQEATSHCKKINLVLAMNYGGRDEIRRAFVKILQENQNSPLSPDQISEEFIATYLDTRRWGDPELVVRTGGEMRLSNFMLWQISYAEIYMTEKLWPDFVPQDLFEAILSFQKRNRRLGGGI